MLLRNSTLKPSAGLFEHTLCYAHIPIQQPRCPIETEPRIRQDCFGHMAIGLSLVSTRSRLTVR